MTQLYEFEQILNFRDFGGYPTQEGGKIKAGKLFRSANFHKSTPSDLSRLAELDIGLLVDLRHLPERKRQPNKWPESALTKVMQYTNAKGPKEGQLAPHEAFVKQDLSVAEDAKNYMRKSYYQRPRDSGFKTIFSNTLKHMAATGDGIVIHCAAGKDRTGTLAAIILSVLGVDEETIMKDYMMTMTAVDIESFLKPAAQAMSERYGRPYSPDALRPMFGVSPDYLEKSLSAIGNMNHYVTESLGLSPQDIDALKAAYIEG